MKQPPPTESIFRSAKRASDRIAAEDRSQTSVLWSDRLRGLFQARPAPCLTIADIDPLTAGYFRQEELRCAPSDRLLSGYIDISELAAAIGLKRRLLLTLNVRFRSVFADLPRLWFVLERREGQLWKGDEITDQPLLPAQRRLTGFDLTLALRGASAAAGGSRLRWIALGAAIASRPSGRAHD